MPVLMPTGDIDSQYHPVTALAMDDRVWLSRERILTIAGQIALVTCSVHPQDPCPGSCGHKATGEKGNEV